MSFRQGAVGPKKRGSQEQVTFGWSFASWVGFMLQGQGGGGRRSRRGSSVRKGTAVRREGGSLHWTVGTSASPAGPWQECIIFCVREEPVLFLRTEEDFVPYTPRDKQNLHENLQGLGPGIQAESLELAIRKEVRVTGVGGCPPPWQAMGS